MPEPVGRQVEAAAAARVGSASDAGGEAVPTPGYLPALDGLRAVAVVAVVGYHLGELRGGFLGVDIFFVISGFLITRLLLAEHERTGRIDLRDFWRRRFRRLLPALLVVLVAVAFASKAWLPAYRLPDIRNDLLGALAYVANWHFVSSGQSYFASGTVPSPIRHTWSLAIEEQFYVVWPLLVVALSAVGRGSLRRRVEITALAVAVLSAGWMVLAAGRGWDLSRLYYGTDTRLFALCAGAWLATWLDEALRAGTRAGRRRRQRNWAWAGTLALVPVAWMFLSPGERALPGWIPGPVDRLAGVLWDLGGRTEDVAFYRFGFQLTAILAVVVVAGLATGEGRVAWCLGSAVPRWLGRRSYGIYLWSWPVQVVVIEQHQIGGRRLVLVVLGLSVALAAVSFTLVEEPLRTGRWPSALDRWRRPLDDGGRAVSAPGMAAPAGRRSAAGGWRPAAVPVAVLAVTVVAVGVAVGAPAKPTYLAVDEDAVRAAALAPAVEGPSDPSEDPGRSPGSPPFDPEAPLDVPVDAQVDPASLFGRPLKVLLTGDSVGWTLGQEISDQAAMGISISNRALIGCGLMPKGTRYVVGNQPPSNYEPFCGGDGAALRAGMAGRPDVALFWVGAWEVYDQVYEGERLEVFSDRYAEVLRAQIDGRVQELRAHGIATVLPVVPCFGPSAVWHGRERLDADRVAWVNGVVRGVAEANRGWVRLIDPGPLLCEADGTARSELPDGTPLRIDGAHFDDGEAEWFWRTWLAGQLAAAFSA